MVGNQDKVYNRLGNACDMSKVKNLVEEKARVLGLEYRSMEVREATAEDDPPLGERLVMDMPDEDIIVKLVPPFSEDDPALECIIENMLCQWKCAQEEGQYYVSLQIKGFRARALVTEVCSAYSHYMGGKRHIEVFGKESFHRYQNTGWEDFIRQGEELIVIPDADQQVAVIASCFKEQMKFDLLGESPEEMPKIIGRITAPFPSVFDTIRATKLNWEGKAHLLVFTSSYLLKKVDLVRSYMANRLVLNARPVTHIFGDSGAQIPRTAASIEFMLDSAYFGSAVGTTSQN